MNYKDAIEQQKKFNRFSELKQTIINQTLTVLTILSAIVALFVLVTVNSYYSAEVVGFSMAPTINSQKYFTLDNSLKNEIAYYTTYKKPQKGDIIIVDYEKAGITDVDAIKRLIAVSGDTICYYNGEILVNGKAIDETYLNKGYEQMKSAKGKAYADEWKNQGYETSKNNFHNFCQNTLNGLSNNTTFTKNFATDYADCIKFNDAIGDYVLTLPQNYVYFLGDNRGGSNDCSCFGPLEKKYMLVKVDYTVAYGTNIFSAMWQSLFK